jgi:hypothetical protein
MIEAMQDGAIFLLAAPDAHRYLLAGVRRPVSRLAPDMLDRNLGLPAPAASAHQITSLVGLVVPLAPAVLHPRGFCGAALTHHELRAIGRPTILPRPLMKSEQALSLVEKALASLKEATAHGDSRFGAI